jgi:hypothetical protein
MISPQNANLAVGVSHGRRVAVTGGAGFLGRAANKSPNRR